MQISTEKIMHYVPTALMAVLVIAIAYSLAQFSLFIINGDQSEMTDAIQTDQAQVKNKARKVDTAKIAQWHLFGKMGEQNKMPVQQTKSAPDTKLRLELVGVYVAPVSTESSAIIIEKGKSESYKVGAKLTGGVTLHEVFADRVILNRNGRFETLRFSEKALSSSSSRNVSKPVVRTSGSRNTTVLSDIRKGRIRSSKDIMRRLNDNPAAQLSSFINEAGLEPIDNGRFRVSPSAPKDVLSAVGLRKGDIINKINGHSPGMIRDDSSLLQGIIVSGDAKIEVQRGKRRFTVSYPLP